MPRKGSMSGKVLVGRCILFFWNNLFIVLTDYLKACYFTLIYIYLYLIFFFISVWSEGKNNDFLSHEKIGYIVQNIQTTHQHIMWKKVWGFEGNSTLYSDIFLSSAKIRLTFNWEQKKMNIPLDWDCYLRRGNPGRNENLWMAFLLPKSQRSIGPDQWAQCSTCH